MNKEEIEKYKIRDYYMIPVEVVDNMFYLFEQQYRKQKEVINKITEIINYYGVDKEYNDNIILRHILKDMLDILKEVSE